ncbi:type IIL restriction-modification enzyme MmeI [Roseobacter sp. N2S]|uniref:type IIL restriction-modification enzyme MmeI n=1 Tax=Roseobacter sp. N2S TaxID=2663844 RepID=UPI003863CBC4
MLDARAKYPDVSLADLYDPDIMPTDLRRAHQANDKAVDRLYRRAVFKSERERVEHLFQLHEKMTDPLLAKPAKKRRGKRVS